MSRLGCDFSEPDVDVDNSRLPYFEAIEGTIGKGVALLEWRDDRYGTTTCIKIHSNTTKFFQNHRLKVYKKYKSFLILLYGYKFRCKKPHWALLAKAYVLEGEHFELLHNGFFVDNGKRICFIQYGGRRRIKHPERSQNHVSEYKY